MAQGRRPRWVAADDFCRKRTDGFTLVELMVVVVIIGILVAVAVPVFNAAKTRAEMRVCHANQRTWAGVVQMIKADGKEPYFSMHKGERLTPGNLWADVAVGQAYLKKVPACPTVEPGFVSYYCVTVGPEGTANLGTLYCDRLQPSTGVIGWNKDHFVGLE